VTETRLESRPLLRKLAAGLVFGFLAVLAVMLMGDIRQVGREVSHFRWVLYPAVLCLTLFNYLLRGYKWHYYIQQVLQAHAIGPTQPARGAYPIRRSARLFVAGFPLAVTPGKVGEVLKAVWLERETGIPAATGVAVVVAERISDGLAVLALSTLGVVAYPQYWPAFALVLGGLLAIVVISQIRPLALWLLDLGERLSLIQRFVHRLREFYEGSFLVFRPRATLTAVGLGTISWLGEGIGFYLILTGLGIEPGWHTASLAIFILAFSTVVGAASTLPGGLGAAEASIAGMLALLLGLPAGTAATATLLIRFATLWFGITLGLIAWAKWPGLIGLERKGPPTSNLS